MRRHWRFGPAYENGEPLITVSAERTMAFWIYKCNSRNRPHQVTYGDWDRFFRQSGNREWGSTEWVPELAKAQGGDVVLAYQTDRNELVGVAEVVGLRRRGSHKHLMLRPVEELRVKLRPLKKQSTAIARIPALQPGPIHTPLCGLRNRCEPHPTCGAGAIYECKSADDCGSTGY